jgi:prepilin-type processing-associated H-X9-DG protein
MRDRANLARCIANLRTQAAGAISFANDRDGMLWSRKEIGFSKYRMLEDPLSPCHLLRAYVGPKTWLCPAGSKTLNQFGNNYTWTVASQFDTTPVAGIENPSKTLLFWDAYSYSLPTMKGASEDYAGDGSSTGPATMKAKFQVKPHEGHSTVNFVYLDGHVETR